MKAKILELGKIFFRCHTPVHPHPWVENIVVRKGLATSKDELYKANDIVPFKKKQFDSFKNRLHSFNVADHNVLLSLLILI